MTSSTFGTHSKAPVDYPDYAAALGEALREKRAERGIMLCGSGVGASMAANRIPGIRAGLCHDTYSAHQGVEHDDMNVLVLGGRVVGIELARELIHAFVNARFTGEGRHRRRLAKLTGNGEPMAKEEGRLIAIDREAPGRCNFYGCDGRRVKF
jgi:RpiB/LacA/LacB family sugar-phosphate isomerase